MEATIFSQRISALIESRGKTPTGVAHDLGITPATLTRYITGIRYPDIRYIVKLSQYFNVSMEWILGLSDERYDQYGEDISELVKLYSLASDDDRSVVKAVLAKYKRVSDKEV